MTASNPRFDISSTSPDASTMTGYSNGQRNHFSGASNLERSSSIREGADNRTVGGSNPPRGTTSAHGDHVFLSQILSQVTSNVQCLDSVSTGDSKATRQVELRKATSAAVGVASEDPTVQPKSLSSFGIEELKRLKSSVHELALKAREKTKIFGESITKLDKYRAPSSSRKRSRPEVPSNSSLSGDRTSPSGSLLRVGSQVHQTPNAVDQSSQRSEERKSSAPNKKARTTTDIRPEGRPNNLLRPSIMVGREREMFRSGNCLAQPEEKERTFQAGTKGKRSIMKSDVSVSAMTGRMLDGDRELKRNIQQRTNNDGRSRLSESHSFRSGPLLGMVPTNKAENPLQSVGLNARSVSRIDHENANEKRDRSITSDKDQTAVKNSLKQTIREENHAAPAVSITKKPSRAPRSNSGASANSSPHLPHQSPTFDSWERSSGANKIQPPSGSSNRKRPLPTQSSSPPVTQWRGQRMKSMRVRRINLVPPVSSRDDVTVLTEGSPNMDPGSKPDSTESNVSGFPRRSSTSSAAHQSKLKSDNVSSTGLSESEESGAGDNKCKDKSKKACELEEKVVPGLQKTTPIVLPQKKKLITKGEGGGDGIRRQGRSGRGLVPLKATNQQPSGKLENAATSKQLRSSRPCPEKGEIKSGRPLSKKLASERKPLTRPRRPMNSGSSDFTGESDDDREELISAIDAAISASDARSKKPFWKYMEPFFADPTQDDLLFLKQQIKQLEERESTLPCTPLVGTNNGRAECGNQHALNDACDIDTPAGKCKWFEKMIPLSQRLLSALIIEEDASDANNIYENGQQDDYNHAVVDDFTFGVGNQIDIYSKGNELLESDSDMWLKNKKRNVIDGSCNDNQNVPNGYQNHIATISNGDKKMHEHDSVIEGSNCNAFGSESGMDYDAPYETMCLDKRILLELHSIGLYPEFVPDLAQKDEEEITDELCRLQEELELQVSNNKNHLCNLEKNVTAGRDSEVRKREILAMNMLVEKAYEKHSGSRGTNSSGGKSAGSKVTKQANMAFVKRTLARCRKFDETGKSCFLEPALKERLYGLSAGETNTKAVSNVIDVATTSSAATVSNLKTPAALENTTVVERSENGDQNSCYMPQEGMSSLEQVSEKDELWNTRIKKKEVLLEDVGNGLLRDTSPSGCNLVGGTKGKRGERDRDSKGQSKEMLTRSGVPRSGRPGTANVKGERKKGSKPKQKTTQLSVNGLVGRIAETPRLSPASVSEREDDRIVRLRDEQTSGSRGNVSHDDVVDLDLSHLPLPGMDDLVTDEQAQDFGSWLNIVDESLQEGPGDLMGLDVPMDDLSELEMIR